MKTPEEIKKGLEGRKDKSNCEWCNLIDQCKRNADALAYIERLEKRLAHAERERDAAVHDLHVLFSEGGHTCMICDVEKTETGCMFDCDRQRKWRGVCKENSDELS